MAGASEVGRPRLVFGGCPAVTLPRVLSDNLVPLGPPPTRRRMKETSAPRLN
jgi:hypothetical protein